MMDLNATSDSLQDYHKRLCICIDAAADASMNGSHKAQAIGAACRNFAGLITTIGLINLTILRELRSLRDSDYVDPNLVD
jgi:hypothetical protein